MIERANSAKRCFVLLAAFLAAVPRVAAEPVPSKDDRLLAQVVCGILTRAHLHKPEITDEISRRLFQRFLKDLDPNKLFFTQSDVDELRKHETSLDDMLADGDLKFAYLVYERLMTRIAQRLKLVEELVAAKHDFTVKEYLDTDTDALPYARTDEELRERWRKRIKFDLLLQRIGDKSPEAEARQNDANSPQRRREEKTKPVSEAEARQNVLNRYQGLLKRWKQVDNADLLEMYFTDLALCIDPHSTYMSPSTVDDFAIAMRLNLDGIGALLRWENGTTMVVEIVPGGAAAADGRLKAKDKIVAVAQGDGKFVDALDMKLRDVVKMIRGPRGTKVQLKVIPVGKIEPIVYDLTRQKIELKSQEARGEVVEQGKKADGSPYRVGVIDLPSFYADQDENKSATTDVRKILKQFTSQRVDGVILDLRHNGGGLLGEALALTGLFIDQGPVVQVKDGEGQIQHRDDPEKGVVYEGPLIVLISRFSASASEILAGALQDYGRALVVGDSATHGKGTVQQIIDLSRLLGGNGGPKLGALKVTIQQFYRVNGDSTQNRGVMADVVLPSLTDVLAPGEHELEHALPFDRVRAVDHADLGLVPSDLRALLRERSAKRVKESAEFAKLAKDVEQFKVRKDRKKLPLNEQELREQFTKDDAEKLDQKVQDATPSDNPTGSDTKYKFKRDFVNNEILQIMEDFLQGRKLAHRQAG
jgi:carboxyl-terminal processing protease